MEIQRSSVYFRKPSSKKYKKFSDVYRFVVMRRSGQSVTFNPHILQGDVRSDFEYFIKSAYSLPTIYKPDDPIIAVFIQNLCETRFGKLEFADCGIYSHSYEKNV